MGRRMAHRGSVAVPGHGGDRGFLFDGTRRLSCGVYGLCQRGHDLLGFSDTHCHAPPSFYEQDFELALASLREDPWR